MWYNNTMPYGENFTTQFGSQQLTIAQEPNGSIRGTISILRVNRPTGLRGRLFYAAFGPRFEYVPTTVTHSPPHAHISLEPIPGETDVRASHVVQEPTTEVMFVDQTGNTVYHGQSRNILGIPVNVIQEGPEDNRIVTMIPAEMALVVKYLVDTLGWTIAPAAAWIPRSGEVYNRLS